VAAAIGRSSTVCERVCKQKPAQQHEMLLRNMSTSAAPRMERYGAFQGRYGACAGQLTSAAIDLPFLPFVRFPSCRSSVVRIHSGGVAKGLVPHNKRAACNQHEVLDSLPTSAAVRMIHPFIGMVPALALVVPGPQWMEISSATAIGLEWFGEAKHLVLECLDFFHNVVEGFVERHFLCHLFPGDLDQLVLHQHDAKDQSRCVAVSVFQVGDNNLDVLQKTLSLVASDALECPVPVLAPLLFRVIVVRHAPQPANTPPTHTPNPPLCFVSSQSLHPGIRVTDNPPTRARSQVFICLQHTSAVLFPLLSVLSA